MSQYKDSFHIFPFFVPFHSNGNWPIVNRLQGKMTSFSYDIISYLWKESEKISISFRHSEFSGTFEKMRGWLKAYVDSESSLWHLFSALYCYPPTSDLFLQVIKITAFFLSGSVTLRLYLHLPVGSGVEGQTFSLILQM
jgi:hypothetical protein